MSGDTVKVLFIGNSLTGYNNMPGLLEQLAITSQKSIFIDKFIWYGMSLEEISERPQISDKLSQHNWDYVVLQGGCHNAAYPETHHIIISFADYRPLLPTLRKLRDMVLENCADTRVVYFLPWAFKDGITWVPGYSDTYFDMQEKILENSLKFADSLNLMIAPVGWAFYQVIRQRSDIELFNPDWSHASLEGSYLAACVFYSTFFEQKVENSYKGGVSDKIAAYFQSVASSTVLDSLALWRIVSTSVHEDKIRTGIKFNLFQNYPNPFNVSTAIKYYLPKHLKVRLAIYDLLGQEIRILVNDKQSEGYKSVIWDGKNDFGKIMSSGLYFYRLKTIEFMETKKLLLLK